jgi:nanoRNase/pAp phosphatase (c-di-AMP/oligoRNAs hydrolase)
MQSWEAAVALVQRSTNILLICHVSPDGDAIGSLAWGGCTFE